jgi:hypothetical protein
MTENKFSHMHEPNITSFGDQSDWLIEYMDETGLHLDHLINDDFINAIRLLYNSKHYVSAMKLLMICIDTLSYLEYGDIDGSFKKWLNTYSELNKLDLTSNELWEFRNSILHMTNLDSRKVITNKEKRLFFYIANPNTPSFLENEEGKYFNFFDLLTCIANGIHKWGESFNFEREKIDNFINRYDRIISDKRMTQIKI